MFARMAITTLTVTVLVALAVIGVCCVVAFPKVRRTLVGLWDALESVDLVIFVLLALAIVGAVVGVVSWALVRSLGGLPVRLALGPNFAESPFHALRCIRTKERRERLRYRRMEAGMCEAIDLLEEVANALR